MIRWDPGRCIPTSYGTFISVSHVDTPEHEIPSGHMTSFFWNDSFTHSNAEKHFSDAYVFDDCEILLLYEHIKESKRSSRLEDAVLDEGRVDDVETSREEMG